MDVLKKLLKESKIIHDGLDIFTYLKIYFIYGKYKY